MTLVGTALASCAVPLAGRSERPQGRRTRSVTFPTGRQYTIAGYDQQLVVTEVGAALRSYQVSGREVLWGFAETELPVSSQGQLLLPWPGRCEGGTYEFQGSRYQLAVTNPQANIAQHGLVRAVPWRAVEHRDRVVTFEVVLYPQQGYPFTLALRQQYELSRTGLVVTTGATNIGTVTAPYATGMHPYFTVGTALIDDNELRVPALQYLPRTPNGAATVPPMPVDGTPWDLRKPSRVGSTRFNPAVAYANLIRDPDGRARTVLSHPSGSPAIEVWTDAATDFVTVFTTSDRRALAIEPCTAPSNALNHGLGLRALAPRETEQSTFGVVVRP
jgi:aldose 1-epimerase